MKDAPFCGVFRLGLTLEFTFRAYHDDSIRGSPMFIYTILINSSIEKVPDYEFQDDTTVRLYSAHLRYVIEPSQR